MLRPVKSTGLKPGITCTAGPLPLPSTPWQSAQCSTKSLFADNGGEVCADADPATRPMTETISIVHAPGRLGRRRELDRSIVMAISQITPDARLASRCIVPLDTN